MGQFGAGRKLMTGEMANWSGFLSAERRNLSGESFFANLSPQKKSAVEGAKPRPDQNFPEIYILVQKELALRIHTCSSPDTRPSFYSGCTGEVKLGRGIRPGGMRLVDLERKPRCFKCLLISRGSSLALQWCSLCCCESGRRTR